MDDNKRWDFAVTVRVVYPSAVSRHDLEHAFEGSTLECAHSLIGTARQLPKDYEIVSAGFVNPQEAKHAERTTNS